MGAFGLVYAGVQKNAGPAGTAVVIVRDDLIAQGPALADVCPTYLDLRVEADKGSLLNTPNCWAIYVCGKVFHWIEDQGGLKAMGRSNWDKVRLLYDYLDQSDLFCGTVRARDRSIVNVRGHRLVGGMRASCYNAVSPASVQELVTCMADFEATHAGAAPENATRAGATPTQVTSGSPADPAGVRSGSPAARRPSTHPHPRARTPAGSPSAPARKPSALEGHALTERNPRASRQDHGQHQQEDHPRRHRRPG